MSNSRLATMTARIHASMKNAGLADGGTDADDGAILRRSSGVEVPCRVFVTRNAERLGEQGQPIFVHAVIAALLADITTVPVRGEVFEIGDDTFTVDRIESQDEATVTVRCKAGT